MTVLADITIRSASRSDRDQLGRLAHLDSQRPLADGPVLLAEIGDQVVAAIDVKTSRTIADPFRPTADVVDLLRLRAIPAPTPRRGLGRARLPHLRTA